MDTCRIYLIRHAPVKKKDGYVPENNPKAIINSDHLKKLAAFIPDNSLCYVCLLYTSPSPRDKRQSRMPSSA